MNSRLTLAGICLLAAFGLAACGGGGGGTASTTTPATTIPEPEPTATPAEMLAAARTAVTEAEAAVAAATTDTERAAAYTQLAEARTALTAAENLPENVVMAQHDAVTMAIATAQGLIDALTATSSQADVDAANTAIGDAQTELDGATALSSDAMTGLGGQISGLTMTVSANDVMRDRHTVSTAVTAAQTAVGGLSQTPTEADVQTANDAVAAAQAALTDASNLPQHEASAYQLVLGSLDAQIMTASSTGEELAAAQRISYMYTAVQTQRNAATKAAEDATAAAKSATDNVGKRTSEAVYGESTTAEANSQAVVDGGTDASAAVTEAKDAKAELEALDTEGIDAAHKAELDKAIEDAVSHVDAQIEAAEDSETSAKAQVAMVVGDDEDNPGSPAKDALAVAMNINTALDSAPSDGMVTPGPTATYAMGAVVMNDADEIGAKTWAQIVGDANIVDARIGAANNATTAVKAMSVDGMTLTNAQDAGAIDDGMQAEGTYKGIAGTVFCNGADCMVEAVEDAEGDAIANMRKLVGSWYFTPDLPKELWVAGATAGTYVVATQYARYGYWLEFNADGVATVNTYAASGSILTDMQTANDEDLNLAGEEGSSVTASYTGDAVGLSVTTDADGNAVASGRFDADVSLTARFGDSPSLSGNVTNFKGDAVNMNWNVVLNQSNLTDAAALETGADHGIAYGGAAAGAWTAQGYGPGPVDHDDDADTEAQNQRPDGFFGRFNANFTDGQAAGAYATRK